MKNTTITLNQAISEFMEAKQAQRLSQNTLNEYQRTLQRFKQFLNGNPPVNTITTSDIRRFLNSLDSLSKKSLRNVYIALSALWTWMIEEEYTERHLIRKIKPPKPEIRAIEPYTPDEIRKMFAVLERSREFHVSGKRPFTIAKPHPKRNYAILLVLLDTGIRNSELCSLKVCDLNSTEPYSLKVFGKGAKERIVPISTPTFHAIKGYLERERGEFTTEDYLFAANGSEPFHPDTLHRVIKRICLQAGIRRSYLVHRFRHTFAVNFLKRTHNPYALQRILGHQSLEIVKRYLALVDADIFEAHAEASPVINIFAK
ncbi:MAG: tyrosine-type recombinase/integrase [Anaerolineae bacterium]|nr:tyrosine-type recombinase/integrase [Anaerolineae bacterium]